MFDERRCGSITHMYFGWVQSCLALAECSKVTVNNFGKALLSRETISSSQQSLLYFSPSQRATTPETLSTGNDFREPWKLLFTLSIETSTEPLKNDLMSDNSRECISHTLHKF